MTSDKYITKQSKPMRFLHVGDLHITERGLQNHLDLRRIVDEVNAGIGDGVDFVILPGDNADDGTPAQFRIVRDELSRLDLPWHVIPGDHDFKQKTLDHFYRSLDARQVPYAETVQGCLCLFLDVVSAGTGGPDFKLGDVQLTWLRAQLAAATKARQTIVVFMHVYPADLRDNAEEVVALLDGSPVVLVDMGHTHYNELANDGRTVYAAVRSTGQIEEGDVGFALAAVDDGAVSWRFKPLDSSWPFVLITSPADQRLVVDDKSRSQIIADRFEIRASVWGALPLSGVSFRIDDDPWQPMAERERGLYAATASSPARRFTLSVRARDQKGGEDIDVISVETATSYAARPFKPTGSDTGRIDAWPERHLLGTQLGPNRNGRKW